MQANTAKLRRLGLIFLIILIFFCPFFKMEYATDTYTIITVGLRAFGDSMFRNGRLITAASFYIFDALSWDVTSYYYVSLVLLLLFSSLAVFQMAELLRRFIPPTLAIPLGFLTVLNPICGEYLLFIEKGYFMLALCMSVFALRFFVDFLGGRRWCLALSVLCVTVSAFTYQTLPGAFAVLAVPFAIVCSKTLPRLFRNLAIGASVYGGASLLNLLFVKLIGGSGRVSSGIHLGNLYRAFFFGGPLICIPIYLTLFSFLYLICRLYVKHTDPQPSRELTLIWFGKCMLTLLGALCVTFFPFLFVNPAEVWFPFRILYPLGTLLGSIAFLFLSDVGERAARAENGADAGEQRPPRAARIYLLVLLILTGLFLQTAVISRLHNNVIDERLCAEIGARIDAYEAESGIEVTSICIYHDADVTEYSLGILGWGDTNIRAFSKEWSDVNHMNVLLGRSFARVGGDVTVYDAHFATRNWNTFHEDQLVFVGNTLHLCVY